MCKRAVTAGADYVKTSTGFHPLGGASVEAVELMAAAVGDGAEIKASGGIRTANSPPHSSMPEPPVSDCRAHGRSWTVSPSSAICRVSIAVPVLPGSGWCES